MRRKRSKRGKRGKSEPGRASKSEKKGYDNGVRKFRYRLNMFWRCPEELALFSILKVT